MFDSLAQLMQSEQHPSLYTLGSISQSSMGNAGRGRRGPGAKAWAGWVMQGPRGESMLRM